MDNGMVCRTCLVDNGELFEVFGETGMELALPQKMQDHLKISIDHTDECALMCGKCIAVLNEFHDMYSLAQEVQAHFATKAVKLQLKKEEPADEEQQVDVYEMIDATEYVEQEEDVGHLEEVIIEETIEEEDEQLMSVDAYETIDASEVYEEEQEGDPDEEEEDDDVTDEDPSDDEFVKRVGVTPRVRAVRKQLRDVQTPEQKEIENELVRSVVHLLCHDCSFQGDTIDQLVIHNRKDHKKDVGVICCDKEFKKRIKLVEHCKLHVDPNAFSCDICDKHFSSKYTLSHHMSSHVPEEMCDYVCEQCPKKFSTKARLSAHQKSHSDQSVVCHICNKTYTQRGTLIAHIKHVHEREADPYICEICAKPFKTKEAFLTHQVNHMETPPPRIACPICSKKMKNRESLNQHILRHKRENDRHYCDICNKEFNCKKRMNQHKKYVHCTEKLQCEHCEKTFKRPIYLKEHMASHTGEHLYTCCYCPRQFNSNANKYSHQKAQHPIEWQMAKQKRLEE